MKRTIKFLITAAMLAAIAAPALAQSKECTPENKAAWYDTFLKNRKGEAPQQKVAYDAAKDYLNCGDDPADQIGQYLKRWVGEYEKITGDLSIKNKLEEATTKKQYAEVVKVGKQVIQNDPTYVRAYILVPLAAYNGSIAGDASLLADGAEVAAKAIPMIEAGKPVDPLASKDSALGWMNYVIGKSKLKNAPADAIPYLLKAARLDNDLKKAPGVYLDLAQAYGDGPRVVLTAKYKPFVGQTETPEGKLILENLNQVIDRQIDALARAAALTTDATAKKPIMDELIELYKYRNKSETGLNELLASVLSKPVPDVPTPITSLPTPTPSSTPVNTGSPAGTNGTQPATSTGGTKPATTTTTTSGSPTGTQAGKTTGPAKPAPSPTPSNKKPRRASHRRG